MKKAYFLLIAAWTLLAAAVSAQNVSPQFDTKKSKWGYVDAAGKWKVKPKYESASAFFLFPNGTKVSEVTLKGLRGFIDENGKPLGVGVIFEEVERISDQTMLVKVKGKSGIINNSGVYVQKPEMTLVTPINELEYQVTIKGKSGIIDREGNVIVPTSYETIDLYLPGYIRVQKGDKIGLLDRYGKMLIEPKEFTSIEPFCGYWKVTQGNNTGLYDLEKGRLIAKTDYADVSEPVKVNRDIFIPVKKDNGKWGVVDMSGKEVEKCRNIELTAVPELGMFLMTRKKDDRRLWFPENNVFLKYHLYSVAETGPFYIVKGKIEHPGKKQPALSAYERFSVGNLSLVTSKDGTLVSSDPDTEITPYGGYYLLKTLSGYPSLYNSEGKFIVKVNDADLKMRGDWLLTGELALSPQQTAHPVRSFGETLFVSTQPNQWQLLNKNGKLEESIYQEMVQEGDFLHLQKNGRWGIMRDGKLAVPCEYSEKLTYSKEFDGFLNKASDKVGLLSTDGKILLPTLYTALETNSDGRILLHRFDKIGIAEKDGTIIIEPIYDSLKEHGDKNLWARQGDRYGVLSSEGKVILPVDYLDEQLDLIDDRYYATYTGTTRYFTPTGEEVLPDKRIKIVSQELEHNIYDDNGAKALKLNFTYDSQFLKDEPIYVQILIFNGNDTPAKKKNGEQIKWGTWHTPSYLFNRSSDHWFTIPYNNFVQPTGSKRDYYAIIKFQDGNGREIPTSGNTKLPFYLTR